MAEGINYYTYEEVAKHNHKDGAKTWIVYKDIVYDVTDYLDDHPGGGELVTEYAGKDCTKAFDDAGHSSDAKKDLKPYKIGEIVEEQRKKKTQKKTETKGQTIVKSTDKPTQRSCIYVITCGLCG